MRSILKAGIAGLMALGLAGCGGSSQPSDNASSAAAPADTTAAAPAAPATPAGPTPPADFAMCAACHSTEAGKTLVGPSLAGVVGRKAGSVAGFAYSDAVKNLGITWDEASLDKWLTNPAAMAPGTKMTFAGYPEAAKRKAMIDYLKTLK
jgi:cytochrome c